MTDVTILHYQYAHDSIPPPPPHLCPSTLYTPSYRSTHQPINHGGQTRHAQQGQRKTNNIPSLTTLPNLVPTNLPPITTSGKKKKKRKEFKNTATQHLLPTDDDTNKDQYCT